MTGPSEGQETSGEFFSDDEVSSTKILDEAESNDPIEEKKPEETIVEKKPQRKPTSRTKTKENSKQNLDKEERRWQMEREERQREADREDRRWELQREERQREVEREERQWEADREDRRLRDEKQRGLDEAERQRVRDKAENQWKAGKLDEGPIQDRRNFKWDSEEDSTLPEEISKKFLDFADENRLSENQFKNLNTIIEDVASNINGPESQAELEKLEEESFNENKAILEKEWGDTYQDKLEKVQYAAIREFGDEGIEYLEKLGVGNDAKFMLMMSKYAEFITEDSYHTGDKSTSINSVESKIDEILGDANGAYFDQDNPSHKRVVAEMDELYKQAYPG